MATDPATDDHALELMVRALADELAGVTRIEIHPGPARETYPSTIEDPARLVSFTDPGVLLRLVDELRFADLSPRVVVPALADVSLVCLDKDGEFLTTIELLSRRWARWGWWPYDALLTGPVPADVAQELDAIDWDTATTRALDLVEPVLPAASRPTRPGLEHAQPRADAPTLCGIPAAEVQMYRHTFQFRRDDCPECARLVWAYDGAFQRRVPHLPTEAARSLSPPPGRPAGRRAVRSLRS